MRSRHVGGVIANARSRVSQMNARLKLRERISTGDLVTCLPGLIPSSCYIVDNDFTIVAAEDESLGRIGVETRSLHGCRFHPFATDLTQRAVTLLELACKDQNESAESLLSFNYQGQVRTFIFSCKLVDLDAKDAGQVFVLVGHDVTHLVEDATRSRYQAIHDPLTGVYNRWFLEDLLHREEARSRRSGDPIAFMYVDVDRFKSINDTYGHDTGDRVLRALAEVLQDEIRDSDVVVRMGGDEFLLILPGAHAATRSLEGRLERAIADAAVHSPLPPFKISLGSSYWEPRMKMRPHEVIMQADAAMYRTRSRHKRL